MSGQLRPAASRRTSAPTTASSATRRRRSRGTRSSATSASITRGCVKPATSASHLSRQRLRTRRTRSPAGARPERHDRAICCPLSQWYRCSRPTTARPVTSTARRPRRSTTHRGAPPRARTVAAVTRRRASAPSATTACPMPHPQSLGTGVTGGVCASTAASRIRVSCHLKDERLSASTAAVTACTCASVSVGEHQHDSRREEGQQVCVKCHGKNSLRSNATAFYRCRTPLASSQTPPVDVPRLPPGHVRECHSSFCSARTVTA